jgi:hypothetical protein
MGNKAVVRKRMSWNDLRFGIIWKLLKGLNGDIDYKGTQGKRTAVDKGTVGKK